MKTTDDQHNDVHQEGQEQSGQEKTPKERRGVRTGRRLLAEFIGTFALTFVAAGADVIAAVSNGQISFVSRMVAPGLLVTVMIYTLGNISGAHFNPAVTLAFAIRKDFLWRRVPGYWAAQFVGAIVAALILRWLFGTAGHLGATLPHYSLFASVVMEVILTFFLITVILATATNDKLVGHNTALAVGAVIALDGMFAGSISGASMNPARTIGPMLVGGELSTAWVYIVGPLLGVALAVGIAWLLRGGTTPRAVEVASGDQGK